MTAFPSTMWSVVQGAGSADPVERARSLETLAAAYWRPVYKTLRLGWRRSVEDAEDLTQGFFAKAAEKDFFARYEPERARFRTFLRTCLERYVGNELRDAARQKRGGRN